MLRVVAALLPFVFVLLRRRLPAAVSSELRRQTGPDIPAVVWRGVFVGSAAELGVALPSKASSLCPAKAAGRTLAGGGPWY